MELTDFLLARIAEDENVAREAKGPPSYVGPLWTVSAASAFGHDLGPRGSVEAAPSRVLAECEAKRRIVAAELLREVGPAGHYVSPEIHARISARTTTTTMRLLALAYAWHHDYRPEWRP